jgi:LysM repeat protein
MGKSLMPKQHKVKQGECISSIAQDYGFSWEQIWNDSANEELKQKREDPNVLFPGDEVVIPDKKARKESVSADQKHKFRRKGVPAMLRLEFVDDQGNPRGNVPYVLDIDGQSFSGNTDGEGKIEQRIPPNAKQGQLRLGDDGSEVYNIRLGSLDPVSETTGVQQRLKNLGYECGSVDGEAGPKTREALMAFQKKHELSETGEIDQQTLDKLQQLHKG